MPIWPHSGHHLQKYGNQVRCTRCGQTFYSRQRAAMQLLGACPGVKIWGEWPRMQTAPWAMPRGSEFIHLGHIMHPSHVFKWSRGVLWCQKCGCASCSKPGYLSWPCRVKPVNNYCKRQLKRIGQGKCPLKSSKGYKPWPLPADSISPYAAYIINQG